MEDACDVKKINLIVMNDTAYVWNSEDWFTLRRLRIVGNFIGNLAALPKQTEITGLPLALLNEETTLLLEKGYAAVKLLPNISNPPDGKCKEACNAFRDEILSQQIEILKNKRKREIESKIDVIMKGKKAKKKSGSNSKELDKNEVLQEEFDKIQPPKTSNLVVQICTVDPWIQDDEYEDYAWEYPRNEHEKLRYSVFKDLWEKEYYLTPGGKFGGDYLAYPGDPVKFHAAFVILCLPKNKKLETNEIITYGRLGQSVRKTMTLAYLVGDEVSYQSIQWSGF